MSARANFDPELPWGCWLRIEATGRGHVYVDDATDRTFTSLRSAFWNGRLGMPDRNHEPPDDMIEIMHAVLAATARGRRDDRETIADLFEGSDAAMRWFVLWLGSAGLVELDDHGHGPKGLTGEGWSVLHMLMATRPNEVRDRRPSAASVRDLVELGLGPEDREARLARVEAKAAGWDSAFLRRDVPGGPTIILSQRGSGPVPVLQTVWSLGFDTEDQRDAFHEWLCVRMDRWQSWGELASEYGSEKLTHKLLAVLAAGVGAEDRPASPPRRRHLD